MKAAVLGAGSWGTALARHLAGSDREVSLWGRDASAMGEISIRRENARYLPGRRITASVRPTADMAAAVRDSELVVLAVPSQAIRSTARLFAPSLGSSAVVVCASKGLEPGSGLTQDRVLSDALPGARIALLSGPTFATEIADGLPAAAVAASRDPAVAAEVQRHVAAERFRIYTTEDVTGVAVGGALKNVIAIAAGCSDGLGFGNNARAALITRGLSEMARLAARLGANPLTMAGLAGLGDLVLTCTGELSRNRRVGFALGRGETLLAILASLGQVAEGTATAVIARDLARDLGVDMPITERVAAILHEGQSPGDAVAQLLARGAGPERG